MKAAHRMDSLDSSDQGEGEGALERTPSRQLVRCEFATHQRDLAHAALLHGEPGAARAALRVLAPDDFVDWHTAGAHLTALRRSSFVPDEDAVLAIEALIQLGLWRPHG